MRLTGILTEDEVDQIILKHLKDEFGIDTRAGSFKEQKHFVQMVWNRCSIEFRVQDSPWPSEPNYSAWDVDLAKGTTNSPPERSEPYPLSELGAGQPPETPEPLQNTAPDDEIPF